MPQQVAGRHAEIARLTVLLDDRAGEPRAVLVEGAPGIGKSCLLQALTELAQERGYVVAGCQPTRTEMELSYVGLVGLLDALGTDVLEALPPPQARVLRTILRLDDGADPVDGLSLGLATVAAVRTVAADRPVLIAVDDSQWLDPPTARTLAFLARRLDGTRCAARVRADPWHERSGSARLGERAGARAARGTLRAARGRSRRPERPLPDPAARPGLGSGLASCRPHRGALRGKSAPRRRAGACLRRRTGRSTPSTARFRTASPSSPARGSPAWPTPSATRSAWRRSRATRTSSSWVISIRQRWTCASPWTRRRGRAS